MDERVSRGISCIVLAAGANTRLSGPNIVPPYMKPLILVNGRPLIQHALRHAIDDWRASEHVIVVSPDNARLITSVIPKRYEYVLQPEPMGVIDAIARAARLVTRPWTLILCADNTFEMDGEHWEMPWHLDAPQCGAFGARQLDLESAKRFTRYTVQNIDVSTHGDPVKRIVRGNVRFIEASSAEMAHGVWIGPLLLDTRRLVHDIALSSSIVQLITRATSDGTSVMELPMLCSDMGIPEEFV